MELGQKLRILAKEVLIMLDFHPQPSWFEDARGFDNLEKGLEKVGFSETERNNILGNNWYNFYKKFDQ